MSWWSYNEAYINVLHELSSHEVMLWPWHFINLITNTIVDATTTTSLTGTIINVPLYFNQVQIMLPKICD